VKLLAHYLKAGLKKTYQYISICSRSCLKS